MKKKVLMFICAALLVLSVVPVINFKLGTKKESHTLWSKTVLFSFDFALPYLSRFFYPLGISIDPNQVIIGKIDWLYLGDHYVNTMTTNRRGITVEDIEAARKIGFAMKSWEQWLKHSGVSLYRIMLGPNKSTIYPEFLPDWAQPSSNSATDTLLINASQGLYIDTRPALILAKSEFSEPLYYKTDTHWNSLGAWVAFRAFTMEVARTERNLSWLTEPQVYLSKVNERQGGDLANFLRMKKILLDSEVTIEIASEPPIDTEQYDFDICLLKSACGNPKIDTPKKKPLLVKSKHALNQKRVLWLRDSFGAAIAPFMAATFTETLQLHYDEADPALFAKLIQTYKPEYVFITVVERDARAKWFENPPPIDSILGKEKTLP